MNYRSYYNRLMNRAKHRLLEGYSERHHIIPRCLGGSNNSDNIVRLTAEEHYVAHQLLVKIYPGNAKLIFAAKMMTVSGYAKRTNNKLYSWLRQKHAAAISEMNTGRKNGPMSDEDKRKKSVALKGRVFTDEHKRNISKARKGIRASAETRAKMSKTHKGLKTGPQRKVICSFCNLEGGVANMKRWHFDNCRFK